MMDTVGGSEHQSLRFGVLDFVLLGCDAGKFRDAFPRDGHGHLVVNLRHRARSAGEVGDDVGPESQKNPRMVERELS